MAPPHLLSQGVRYTGVVAQVDPFAGSDLYTAHANRLSDTDGALFEYSLGPSLTASKRTPRINAWYSFACRRPAYFHVVGPLWTSTSPSSETVFMAF